MALFASVGSAQALDGREAGLQAAHQALNGIGANAPGFAIVIASHQYQSREVLNGVISLLGDTPVLGFASPAGLTARGAMTGVNPLSRRSCNKAAFTRSIFPV